MRNLIKTIFLVCVVLAIGSIYRIWFAYSMVKKIMMPINAHVVVTIQKDEQQY